MLSFASSNNDDIPFYNYEVMREEIEQILSCILHINAGNQESILHLPGYVISRTSFDMLSLAKSKRFSDLLNVARTQNIMRL